jgi:hypothetical protein
LTAIALPDQLLEFLEDATIAIVGTRGPGRAPNVHRPSGFRAGEDRKSVICYFPDVFLEGLSSALEDNGEIALTVSQAPSHETYQLKGTCIDSGPVASDDLRVYEAYLARAVPRLAPIFGLPEAVLRENIPPPTVRVRFAVREVFDQTPGPGAGRRIVPPEEDRDR